MGKAGTGQYESEINAVRVHRGIDDGMLARGVLWQHGKSRAERRQRAKQPAAREGRAGLHGMAERPVLPTKPGNAGGGKGPWFKGNAGRSKGKEIGVSLITPESVWQLQEALQAKAKSEPAAGFTVSTTSCIGRTCCGTPGGAAVPTVAHRAWTG